MTAAEFRSLSEQMYEMFEKERKNAPEDKKAVIDYMERDIIIQMKCDVVGFPIREKPLFMITADIRASLEKTKTLGRIEMNDTLARYANRLIDKAEKIFFDYLKIQHKHAPVKDIVTDIMIAAGAAHDAITDKVFTEDVLESLEPCGIYAAAFLLEPTPYGMETPLQTHADVMLTALATSKALKKMGASEFLQADADRMFEFCYTSVVTEIRGMIANSVTDMPFLGVWVEDFQKEVFRAKNSLSEQETCYIQEAEDSLSRKNKKLCLTANLEEERI